MYPPVLWYEKSGKSPERLKLTGLCRSEVLSCLFVMEMRHPSYVASGLLAVLLVILFLLMPYEPKSKKGSSMMESTQTDIKLPAPRLKGSTSLEKAISKRRSVREYSKEPLSLQTVAQLLWAAQGITGSEGGRTAPSAGALYPLEVYLVSGAVTDLPAGVYHYLPATHRLRRVASGDKRKLLAAAAGMQDAVMRGAAVLIIAADYERTRKKYGERATRYVHMEAGHVAQNVYLQAEALNTGTVVIGAFSDVLVRQVLSLSREEAPLYLMPLGNK